MVFGHKRDCENMEIGVIDFNSPWELDGVRTLYFRRAFGNLSFINFNSPWELDGVRTREDCKTHKYKLKDFNSPWELDGVRTLRDRYQGLGS